MNLPRSALAGSFCRRNLPIAHTVGTSDAVPKDEPSLHFEYVRRQCRGLGVMGAPRSLCHVTPDSL